MSLSLLACWPEPEPTAVVTPSPTATAAATQSPSPTTPTPTPRPSLGEVLTYSFKQVGEGACEVSGALALDMRTGAATWTSPEGAVVPGDLTEDQRNTLYTALVTAGYVSLEPDLGCDAQCCLESEAVGDEASNTVRWAEANVPVAVANLDRISRDLLTDIQTPPVLAPYVLTRVVTSGATGPQLSRLVVDAGAKTVLAQNTGAEEATDTLSNTEIDNLTGLLETADLTAHTGDLSEGLPCDSEQAYVTRIELNEEWGDPYVSWSSGCSLAVPPEVLAVDVYLDLIYSRHF